MFPWFHRLNVIEKKVFRLHLIYSLLEGFALGVLALNEFVFLKSLNGNNYQLGLLFQFSVVVFCFLIFFNEILRRINNKRKLLRITALVTRLPLFLLLFFPHTFNPDPFWHYLFLSVFFIYYASQPVVTPVINILLKNSYSHQSFGRLYSISQSANKIIMLITTFLYGFILDVHPFSYAYFLSATGICGIVALYFLSAIPYTSRHEGEISFSFGSAIRKSALRMIDILKKNRPFLHFETGFMIYGFAFMISVTVITIYFYKVLDLNYASVAFYRNIYNILAIIMLPFFGRIIGKIDPRIFAIYTYLSIAMFIIFLSLTRWYPSFFMLGSVKIFYLMIPFLLFHGIYAATMVLLWNIGSVYFCRSHEAGDYQAVHMSLTGIRALFAPTSGVIIYELFGFQATFASAVITLCIAMIIMWWSYRRVPVIMQS